MTSAAPAGETVFTDAIRHWWSSKAVNVEGVPAPQGGTRHANLRGDTMNGFRDTVIHELTGLGVKREDIFSGGNFSPVPANLPSYFRASKNWDLIVCKNSRFKSISSVESNDVVPPQLILAIEFKSQHGSISNNQNNRIEESIGNAADFWASYENRNFIHLQPRPWLGYLFVGRYDDEEPSTGVEIKQPHFLSDEAFRTAGVDAPSAPVVHLGPGYAERYRIFLERMIAKKYYDGACFIASNERIQHNATNYVCPFSELSGLRFIDAMLRHARAYYF